MMAFEQLSIFYNLDKTYLFSTFLQSKSVNIMSVVQKYFLFSIKYALKKYFCMTCQISRPIYSPLIAFTFWWLSSITKSIKLLIARYVSVSQIHMGTEIPNFINLRQYYVFKISLTNHDCCKYYIDYTFKILSAHETISFIK